MPKIFVMVRHNGKICNVKKVELDNVHRRRIYSEEKAKVVAAA